MTEDQDLLTLVRSVAAFDLPGFAGEVSTFKDEGGEWPAFLDSVTSQRLTGLAMAAEGAGLFELTQSQTRELLDRHRDAMEHVLRLEQKLLVIAAALDEAGVEAVVLKGSSLAHEVYPDRSWRAFGDLDLLVPTGQWRTACRVLADLDLRRRLPEPRRGFDERFGKAAAHVDDDGFEIDLHRTLVVGPFGLWMNVDELLGRTTTFLLGGRELRRLDDTSLFLHACVHASLGWTPPLLLPLRDVAQVACGAEVDWDLAERLTARWRLAPVIRHAAETVERELGVVLPSGALRLAALPAGRVESRAQRAYCGERRREMALFTLLAIPGVTRKAEYVRDLVVPARDFLEARTPVGERPSYRRRWAVPLRWLRGTYR